ncbi:MAG: bifunctional DNA primase/polymerase [Pseudomonadota bacterium]
MGVDIRSEGGQIVAAPSVHASGRPYRWFDAREPAVLP